MAGRRKSRSLVGAAVGSGIVARAAEQGGADFLLAINAGRMRIMGAPSIACMLPMHDAGRLTWEFATSEILPMTSLPVYVGVNAWQPGTSPQALAKAVMEAGFAGAVNFPSAMHFSTAFRRILDQSGLGTRAEIALLQAVQAVGGKSMFYCGTPQQARDGADAGLSALVYNFGWNLGGALGHKPRHSLEEAAFQANEVSRFLKRHRGGLKLFLEGGPIAAADDLGFISEVAEIDGYVGGSTLDRMPIESSIGDQIAGYRHAMDVVRRPSTQDKRLITAAKGQGLVGESAPFVEALRALYRAAHANLPVFLHLPEGCPVEPILHLLQHWSPKHLRSGFVDCRHLLEAGTLEPALFGTPGTGQELLRRPNTHLILQEVATMAPSLHQRLARVVQTGAYDGPAGDRKKAQALLVLISTQPPSAGFEEAVQVFFPPVAERYQDVEKMLRYSLERQGAAASVFARVGPSALQRLKAHPWPGNDAEIDLVARRLLHAVSAGGAVEIGALLDPHPSKAENDTLPTSARQQLIDALVRHNFRRSDTAHALNITRKTLYNRMKRYELL
ncbi:MAG: phosphoenolpyruvate hydrolase family protein [Pseudomonadota bacterium]